MTVAGKEPRRRTLFVIVMLWPAAPKRRLMAARAPTPFSRAFRHLQGQRDGE
jgi:hypothetical protein